MFQHTNITGNVNGISGSASTVVAERDRVAMHRHQGKRLPLASGPAPCDRSESTYPVEDCRDARQESRRRRGAGPWPATTTATLELPAAVWASLVLSRTISV